MTLEHILADFQLLDDWDDRYRYVIELGRALPPLPEAARTEANRVRGCASQVWLATEVKGAGAAPCLIFKGDSDAHISIPSRSSGCVGSVKRAALRKAKRYSPPAGLVQNLSSSCPARLISSGANFQTKSHCHGRPWAIHGRISPAGGRPVGGRCCEKTGPGPDHRAGAAACAVDCRSRAWRADHACFDSCAGRPALETGAGGPTIVGRADNADVLRLQGFLRHNGHPHQLLNPETDDEAKALIERFHIDPGQLPIVLLPRRTNAAQSRPSNSSRAVSVWFGPSIRSASTTLS